MAACAVAPLSSRTVGSSADCYHTCQACQAMLSAAGAWSMLQHNYVLGHEWPLLPLCRPVLLVKGSRNIHPVCWQCLAASMGWAHGVSAFGAPFSTQQRQHRRAARLCWAVGLWFVWCRRVCWDKSVGCAVARSLCMAGVWDACSGIFCSRFGQLARCCHLLLIGRQAILDWAPAPLIAG